MCYKCGEKGYIAGHFPKRNSHGVFCIYCRKPGHTKAECYTRKRDEDNRRKKNQPPHAQKSRAENVMVCDEIGPTDEENNAEKDVFSTKRTAAGEPALQKVRICGELPGGRKA